jgi:hypothetical protein
MLHEVVVGWCRAREGRVGDPRVERLQLGSHLLATEVVGELGRMLPSALLLPIAEEVETEGEEGEDDENDGEDDVPWELELGGGSGGSGGGSGDGDERRKADSEA